MERLRPLLPCSFFPTRRRRSHIDFGTTFPRVPRNLAILFALCQERSVGIILVVYFRDLANAHSHECSGRFQSALASAGSCKDRPAAFGTWPFRWFGPDCTRANSVDTSCGFW